MWSYLIAAVVGLSSGLAGVIYTNWRSERLEKRRWEREDANRSYGDRHQAYMEFLAKYQKIEDAIIKLDYEHGGTGNFPDPPEDWLVPLYQLLTNVEIFGTTAAGKAATRALFALDGYGTTSKGTYEDIEEAKRAYLTQIRQDLGVKDE